MRAECERASSFSRSRIPFKPTVKITSPRPLISVSCTVRLFTSVGVLWGQMDEWMNGSVRLDLG